MVNKIRSGYTARAEEISFTIRASRMGSTGEDRIVPWHTICFTIEASSMGS
jgi:hypothetical protein